jgi:hypothetical protein
MTTRRVLLALPLLLGAWLAVLALAMRLGAPAPAALVVLPPEGFWARLPPSVALLDQGGLGVIVRSGDPGEPGLVPALYAAGARLVLPAGLAGCLGLAA